MLGGYGGYGGALGGSIGFGTMPMAAPQMMTSQRMVDVPVPHVQTRHVPRVETQIVDRHVPRVETQIVDRHVPRVEIQTVERVVEVPQVQIKDVMIEVPQVQEVIRHVPKIEVTFSSS